MKSGIAEVDAEAAEFAVVAGEVEVGGALVGEDTEEALGDFAAAGKVWGGSEDSTEGGEGEGWVEALALKAEREEAEGGEEGGGRGFVGGAEEVGPGGRGEADAGAEGGGGEDLVGVLGKGEVVVVDGPAGELVEVRAVELDEAGVEGEAGAAELEGGDEAPARLEAGEDGGERGVDEAFGVEGEDELVADGERCALLDALDAADADEVDGGTAGVAEGLEPEALDTERDGEGRVAGACGLEDEELSVAEGGRDFVHGPTLP